MGFLSNVRQLFSTKPCYRCGTVKGDVGFAGYSYCTICAKVVSSMNPMLAHDPPFGFPGAKGYVEFVGKEK